MKSTIKIKNGKIEVEGNLDFRILLESLVKPKIDQYGVDEYISLLENLPADKVIEYEIEALPTDDGIKVKFNPNLLKEDWDYLSLVTMQILEHEGI